MKKMSFLLIVFFTVTLSVHSQDFSNITSLEKMGKYAFNILKNLDKTSEKEFKNSFLSLAKIKMYVNIKQDYTKNETRDDINKIATETFNQKIIEEYTSLKEKGKEFNIEWNAIEYLDYTYSQKTKDGFTVVRGKLIFKHKENKYQVIASAFFVDNVYKPLIIRRLREKN
ncbi:hypothetical protein [Kordia sp.]|uniref:hypothetical protein n=1 Tax=Kordia sp. TaxID=1965332 RepID=UPI003D6A9213